jgi:hypothetical protein
MHPTIQHTLSSIFEHPHANGTAIQDIILNHVNLDAPFSILECQQFLSKVLCDCHIITDSDTQAQGTHPPSSQDHSPPPKFQEWLQALMDRLSEQKLPLTQAAYDTLLTFHDDFKALGHIHKLICNIPDTCQQKINACLEPEYYSNWESVRTWLNTTCADYLGRPKGLDEHSLLHSILKDYLNTIQAQCDQMLAHQFKDHLHAKVNHTIILPKIMGDTGWKSKLHTMQGDPRHFIRECEDTIKSDLSHLTKNITAPFMETFYNELYTRCYKQLMSPMHVKEDASTIHRLTAFDISQDRLTEPKPIPNAIQHTLDTAYLLLLKTICHQAPNIREHVLQHPIDVSLISAETTIPEKKYLSNFAKNIYRSVRHYERLLDNATMSSISPEGTVQFIGFYLTTLELTHHAYRPFLVEYIDLLGVFINQQKITQRQYYLDEHNSMIQQLKSINDLMSCLQLLNPYLSQPTTEPHAPILSNHDILAFIQDHSEQLSPVQPWDHTLTQTTHLPLCQQLIDVLGLSRRPKKKKRKITALVSPIPATVSEWISQPPADIDL